MVQKTTLGRGLGSLINSQHSTINEVNDNKISNNQQTLMVPVEKIQTAKAYQPRKIFNEKELNELAQSIKESGIISPLVVRVVDNHFELIAGERRLRAAKIVGLESVPVVIKQGTDRDRFVWAIIENIQRENLNCVEEALAYFKLMEEFKLTQEEISKKVGKERSTIANFLRILKLPREVIEFLQKDILSFGHGKVLVSIKDNETCKRIANHVVANELSVRELEKHLTNLMSEKTLAAPIKKENDTRYDQFRNKLESKTGFHFNIKANNKGSGNLVIKFNNEAEFNDIFEFLMKR